MDAELVAMQEWVKSSGAKVCVVFEGRDTAGKGGTIKAITDRVSPRVFRVVALPAPTEREKLADVLPALRPALTGRRRGRDLRPQLVQPGRGSSGSWGSTEDQVEAVPRRVPASSGPWSTRGSSCSSTGSRSSPDEQTRRLESRIDDPRKIWKLSDMDLKSYSRWWDYERARDDMFAGHRHRVGAVVRGETNDKRRGRLNIITHLLSQVPYKPLEPHDVALPKRQKKPSGAPRPHHLFERSRRRSREGSASLTQPPSAACRSSRGTGPSCW